MTDYLFNQSLGIFKVA